MNNCFCDFPFNSFIQCFEESEFGIRRFVYPMILWLLIVMRVFFWLVVIQVVFWPFCRVFDISLATDVGCGIFDRIVPRIYYPFLKRRFVLIEVNFRRSRQYNSINNRFWNSPNHPLKKKKKKTLARKFKYDKKINLPQIVSKQRFSFSSICFG